MALQIIAPCLLGKHKFTADGNLLNVWTAGSWPLPSIRPSRSSGRILCEISLVNFR